MHFFELSVITDQPKFQLSLTLHALLSLASSPSFSCLYRRRFLRQLTSIDECIFSFPRVEGVSSGQTQSPSRFGARVCSFLARFSSLWNVTSTNRPHEQLLLYATSFLINIMRALRLPLCFLCKIHRREREDALVDGCELLEEAPTAETTERGR